MFRYKGKTVRQVGLLGGGKSNVGVYSYLSKRHSLDFTLRVFDKNSDYSAFGGCKVLSGPDMLSDINEDVLFLSPSARRDSPKIREAFERGVILSSDAEFFFENSVADIFAVTGSDGKSTTAYLTSQLLKSSYKDTVACGNIGEAMTPHVDNAEAAFVTELSSFQLSYLKPRSLRSVITNVTENHLDWHKSFDEYINAKKNIFDFSSERIFSADCEISKSIAKDYNVFAVFSTKLDDKTLCKTTGAKLRLTLGDGGILANGTPILDTRRIRAPGAHTVKNFMAAIAMSYGYCTAEDISSVAESFCGLSHRCELVAQIDGVDYYDSSIDSTPKRSIATLLMMTRPVVLILGGHSKGLDFGELIPIIASKAKFIIITGECADEIEDAIASSGSASHILRARIDDFTEAVEYAKKRASCGDAVLLSPAATSYDKFKNFEERGNAFARIIKNSY